MYFELFLQSKREEMALSEIQRPISVYSRSCLEYFGAARFGLRQRACWPEGVEEEVHRNQVVQVDQVSYSEEVVGEDRLQEEVEGVDHRSLFCSEELVDTNSEEALN